MIRVTYFSFVYFSIQEKDLIRTIVNSCLLILLNQESINSLKTFHYVERSNLGPLLALILFVKYF